MDEDPQYPVVVLVSMLTVLIVFSILCGVLQ